METDASCAQSGSTVIGLGNYTIVSWWGSSKRDVDESC